jgi:adenylate kinase
MLRDARRQGTDIGRKAAEFIDSGRLVPDDIVSVIVAQRLAEPDCQRGCLLDGFPRTAAQATALDRILASVGKPLDAVLLLDVDVDELTKRLQARRRSDDRPDAVERRLADYESLTRPLFEYYQARGILHAVDGHGTIDEVFERITATLAKIESS